MKPALKVRELKIEKRLDNFKEVVLGYTEKEAQEEAKRCFQCKNPRCVLGCPVNIDIKKFIFQITKKDYYGAYLTIKEKNNFASICGRVCPAEYQCKKMCVLNRNKGSFADSFAINIHLLERFVGDWGNKNVSLPEKNKRFKNKKVAVVGSGPAGLCVAYELAKKQIEVVVFEALNELGGILRYGIPSFRLPRKVLDFEINYLRKLGVKFITNFLVGQTTSLEDLFKEGISAIFLGTGAGIPKLLGIKGEGAPNVYTANEFLTRVNLLNAYQFPRFHTPLKLGKKIAIIGAGNTAIDCARVALRLQRMNGLKIDTTIIYRRTEIQMPARRIEIEHAKEEGVNFKFLTQPEEFVLDKNGYVKKIKCLRTYLGEKDRGGRERPIILEGSDFFVKADLVIVAIGLKANQLLIKRSPQLKLNREGNLFVNGETLETTLKGVFAGGDIVSGEATVIEAMGMGKKAANSIIKYLSNA